MKSVFLCVNNHVSHFRASTPPSQQFLDWLIHITGETYKAVFCDVTRLELPLSTNIPPGKTFYEYVKVLEEFLKRKTEQIPFIDCEQTQIVIYKYKSKYGIISAAPAFLEYLQSKQFPVTIQKIYERSDFTDVILFDAWLQFYDGVLFETDDEIQKLLHILQPPSDVPRLPGLAKEIMILKSLALPQIVPAGSELRMNTAETSVISAFPTNADKLIGLRIVQSLLMRQMLAQKNYTAPPRTSDITAQFNSWIQESLQISSAVQEVGTVLKVLGFQNKRTATGVIWPELVDRDLVNTRIVGNAILCDVDLGLGTASLFNGL